MICPVPTWLQPHKVLTQPVLAPSGWGGVPPQPWDEFLPKTCRQPPKLAARNRRLYVYSPGPWLPNGKPPKTGKKATITRNLAFCKPACPMRGGSRQKVITYDVSGWF